MIIMLVCASCDLITALCKSVPGNNDDWPAVAPSFVIIQLNYYIVYPGGHVAVLCLVSSIGSSS